jgi:hypothetical protein
VYEALRYYCIREGTRNDFASMQPYAPYHLLTTARVCSRVLTYADVCRRMRTYADVCSRTGRVVERAVTLAPAYAPALTSLASILHNEGASTERVEELFRTALRSRMLTYAHVC